MTKANNIFPLGVYHKNEKTPAKNCRGYYIRMAEAIRLFE